MAITTVFGQTGSGKSYFGTYTIYNAFINEKSPTFGKYTHFFTNLAEFNFDKFPDKGFQLKPKEFISAISQLRAMFLYEKTESEIIEKSKELKLFGCLIVWDEAQTYISKKNEVLFWFVEYQRHLSQDIVFFAQTPSRVQEGIKDLSHNNYRAVSPAMRLGKNFEYKRFGNADLYQNSYIDTLTLKPDPKIFELYHSGNNEQPKKLIHKFLFLILVFTIIAVSVFYYALSRWSHGDDNVSEPVNNPSDSLYSPPVNSASFSVVCVGFECSYLGNSVSLSDLNKYDVQYHIFPTVSRLSEGVFLRIYPLNAEFIKGVFNVSLSADSSD